MSPGINRMSLSGGAFALIEVVPATSKVPRMCMFYQGFHVARHRDRCRYFRLLGEGNVNNTNGSLKVNLHLRGVAQTARTFERYDLLIWISEEVETSEYPWEQWAYIGGVVCNFLFMLARANSRYTPRDDVFEESSAGSFITAFVRSQLF